MNKVSRLFEEEKQEAVRNAREEAIKKEKRKIAEALLEVLPLEVISDKTGLSIEEVKEIKVKNNDEAQKRV